MNCNFESFRRRAGLTQEDSAAQLGVSQGAISQWETGAVKPRTELLPRIAALYGCTIDELLKEQNSA